MTSLAFVRTHPNQSQSKPVETPETRGEKSLKTIERLCTKYSRYLNQTDRTNVKEGITNALVNVFDAIKPPKTTEFTLAFESNPHSEIDKTRVQDAIKWCSAADKFYEWQLQVTTISLNENRKKMQEKRKKMEHTIRDVEAREALYNTVFVHIDTQLIARINRMPHDIVTIIGEYLPKNVAFAVSLPSVDEMKATLSKVTLKKLNKLLQYVEDRHMGYDQTGVQPSIGFIKRKAKIDKVIACSYIDPHRFNWGHNNPKVKEHVITTIVGYVRVYEYHANIFKTAAAKPEFPMQQEYARYGFVFQDEALHIVKFMRFLSKQKKVSRPRVAAI
jgi:hypothetical protein